MVIRDPKMLGDIEVRPAQVVGWAVSPEIASEAARLLAETGEQPALQGYRPEPGDLKSWQEW